jgi:nucleotide-binding universal stress UspA family protein
LRGELAADLARTGAALVAQWKARGVKLTFTAVEGSSQVALCERAASTGADLIVVGSHGRRGLRRLILGSVAETTVRHAPCSVLIAR